jgi:predicted DNA-binding transcriptional regulator YafY
MRQLQLAFVRESVVTAEYVKETGESSERRIEPHALLITWPAWYLLAYDHFRGGARTFRFDRFRRVDIEDGAVFRPRPRDIATAILGEHCEVPMNQV